MATGRNETLLDLGIYIALLPPEHHGGAELQADRLARELAARGHRVQIFARRQGEHRSAEWREGVRIHRRPVVPVAGLRGVADSSLAWRKRSRRGHGFYSMTFNNGILGTVAGACLGAPAVVWQRLEGESVRGIAPWKRRIAIWVEQRAAQVWLQAEAFRAGHTAPRLRIVGNGIDLPPALVDRVEAELRELSR